MCPECTEVGQERKARDGTAHQYGHAREESADVSGPGEVPTKHAPLLNQVCLVNGEERDTVTERLEHEWPVLPVLESREQLGHQLLRGTQHCKAEEKEEFIAYETMSM